MPLNDLQARTAYHNAYAHTRYHQRRKASIKRLGARCVKCGDKSHLQFVYTDPTLKVANVAQLFGFKVINIGEVFLASEVRYREAIAKCFLVCKTCTSLRARLLYDPTMHGTLAAYRYCHCSVCKTTKNAYMQGWKAERRLKQIAQAAQPLEVSYDQV